MATKKAARKAAARKSPSRSGAKAKSAKSAKAERGAKQRSPLSVPLVDGDRAADPTVGKNVATAPPAPKSGKEAGSTKAAGGAKGRSLPEATPRGSGNPPEPVTTDADRRALAEREKLDAERAERAAER